jgi:predicted transcriptional regulator
MRCAQEALMSEPMKFKEWQIAAIEEGVREAEQGRFIDHARLKAKWEKKLAAVTDKTRQG